MIKSLKVTNHNGQSLLLPLADPWTPGLAVWGIEGLGPPKATINSNETALIDGGIFTSARLNQRNLVITLVMMDDPLIEDARLKTYRYFPIKKSIHLEIVTDRRHAECDGYVESNEPNIFSNMESTQISVICPDPYFYELGGEEVAFAGVHASFEFPFSNESLTERLLEFGQIRDDNRAVINYVGDVDTGVHIVIHALSGNAENITIWNVNTREKFKIDTTIIMRSTGIQFSQGDDIEINTKIGEKYVRLLHDGVYYNIISAVNKDADWFQLTTGPNVFTFVCEAGGNNLMATFQYRNAYGGI